MKDSIYQNMNVCCGSVFVLYSAIKLELANVTESTTSLA